MSTINSSLYNVGTNVGLLILSVYSKSVPLSVITKC